MFNKNNLIKNKKGFVRTIEAVIAGLIVLGFIAFFALPMYNIKVPLEDEVYKIESNILDGIEKDPNLRNAVFSFNSNPNSPEVTNQKNFVLSELGKNNLAGGIIVCSTTNNLACNIPEAEQFRAGNKEIFVRDRIFSTSLTSLSLTPQKVVVYAWLRG